MVWYQSMTYYRAFICKALNFQKNYFHVERISLTFIKKSKTICDFFFECILDLQLEGWNKINSYDFYNGQVNRNSAHPLKFETR